MDKNEIGTAEIAKLTGLSQRQVRYSAKAGARPWPVTRPQRRGFWFQRDKLAGGGGWLERRTIDPCEPKRRGRKRKAAYTRLESMPADNRVVFIQDTAKFTRELAALSKALAAKLVRIAPHLSLGASEGIFNALKPLERARLRAGSKYMDAELQKPRSVPNNS